MKKLLLLSMLLMALCMSAKEVTFTSSSDTSEGVSLTKDGVTISIESTGKGSLKNTSFFQCYSGSNFTISATENITKVVFTCTANGSAKYGPGCYTIQDGNGSYTFESSGKNGTWTGSQKKIVFTASSNQVRMTTIVVTVDDAVPVTGISVKTLPTKTSYYTGETLKLNGGEITVNYDNDTEENLSMTAEGVTVTGYDKNTIGTQSLTVTYAGKETYFNVNVSKNPYIFKETFNNYNTTGGNDGNWSSGASGEITTNDPDNEGWEFTKAYGANACIKLGSSSEKGSAITPALSNISGTVDCVLSFKAAAWNASTEETTLNISIAEGGGSLSEKSVTLGKGEWTDYVVSITGATATTKIKFEAAKASKNRYFLDEVEVIASEELKIGTTGMSTFCTKNALDFTGVKEISAYVANEVSGSTVVLTKVNGAVKGNTGLMIVGTADVTEDIPVVTDGVDYTATNMLKPWFHGQTLKGSTEGAHNYVYATHQTSGTGFFRLTEDMVNNAGNRAYLTSNANYTQGQNAPMLSIAIGGGTSDVVDVEAEEEATEVVFYDLMGRRVTNPGAGVYICNGKKVIIK